eukprot:150078_1
MGLRSSTIKSKTNESYTVDEISAVLWTPDHLHSECMMTMCHYKFSTTYRKHHCRFCGFIVCSSCSRNRYRSKRICVQCYSKLTVSQIAGEKRDAITAANDNRNAVHVPPPLVVDDRYNLGEFSTSLSPLPDIFEEARYDPRRASSASTCAILPESGTISPRRSFASALCTPYTQYTETSAFTESKTFLLLSDDDFVTQDESFCP